MTTMRRKEPDLAVPARPRLAEDVRVHPPSAAGTPWIVERPGAYLRVGADLAKLAGALDGARDHEELRAYLGPQWTGESLAYALGRLKQAELLHDGLHRKPGVRWLKFVPPLTVQITLLRPARLLAACAPLFAALARRGWGVVAAMLALGGLAGLALMSGTLADTLSRPLPLPVYASVAGATYAVIMLHELAHGAVLTYYGGRPNRMGFMLLYLLPAFFCDVSDGWRLAEGRQRVRVALAGAATQFVTAGSASLAALFTPDSDLRTGLVLFSALNYTSGLLNLLPFIKLDGYLALMSHLDISDLRKRAMIDARRYTAKLLFGGRYERELPQVRWAVPYGLACQLFPIYLVGWMALSLWGDLLRSFGVVGTVALLVIVAVLLGRLCHGLLLRMREARQVGAPAWRAALVTVAVAGAAAALLTLVQVPYSVTGGYRYQSGRAELVLNADAGPDVLRSGATVQLLSNGVVFKERIGTARIAGTQARQTSVPVSVMLPVRTDLELPGTVDSYPLEVTVAPSESQGAARIEAGHRPLGVWLYLTYVSAAW
ncbi:daptide biosynthesis intramembrane metalloprotease [Nonomuraea sp. CA-141351]|uniref:daptide biosynthesis intramembrane metalloprotease n=1 Tax=Nonomuraea sp. CA-141351 TaxID=3239996 RepID=UPI003D8B5FF9